MLKGSSGKEMNRGPPPPPYSDVHSPCLYLFVTLTVLNTIKTDTSKCRVISQNLI